MAQTTSPASAPNQTIAAPTTPSIQTSGKPLVIEIAKVPDGKTLDPHWTTYVTALGTPFVAVIAAAIAATIQYRQWKTANVAAVTAKNKLKLDLFDKRFALYMAIMQILITLADEKEPDQKLVSAALGKTAGIEFLFNEQVRKFYDELCVHLSDRMTSHLKLLYPQQRKPGDDEEQLRATYLKEVAWFKESRATFESMTKPYLRLTH